jgi:glycosyltransferase involved in cell wall biosynthesis
MTKITTYKPLVSIIVPSLNQGRYIKKTIDSILNQTYKPLECIVIDGGSTDETLSVLKNYGSRIFFVSEKDNGQADAINKGLNLASGEILTYINSDDYLLPDTVSDVINTFNKSDRLWVTGNYLIVDEFGLPIQSFIVYYKQFLRIFSSRFLIKIANYIIQPGTFWKRELQDTIGLFDTTLRYVMDYDFWLRAFVKHTPVILNKKLSAFRVHKLSKGGSQFVNQFTEEILVLKRYCKNSTIINIHYIHNVLIKYIYRIIK